MTKQRYPPEAGTNTEIQIKNNVQSDYGVIIYVRRKKRK